MIIRPGIATIWHEPFPDLDASLDKVFVAAPRSLRLFFRADDVAIPSGNFSRMINLFRKYETPLEMAVVPAWLRTDHAQALLHECPEAGLFRLHQHGWRHVTHQLTGKKGEFGTDRSRAVKRADLQKGRDKLLRLLGDRFEQRFTPPWNRFDAQTATLLGDLGYESVSRSSGEDRKVPLPDMLPDFPINVDLHTRNEATPAASRQALLEEMAEELATGHCGIMLHHQRMNDNAFAFLDGLLHAVARARVSPMTFAAMLS